MALEHLPENIFLQILTKLPAISLVRLCRVCKAWNASIKSSNLIQKHLENLNNNKDDPALFFLWSFHDKVAGEYREELFAVNSHRPLSLVASRCVSKQRKNTIRLYNPTAQKDLTLPPGDLFLSNDEIFATQSAGFGFDESYDDCKVVRIAKSHDGVSMGKARTWLKQCSLSFGMDKYRQQLLMKKNSEALKHYIINKLHVEIYRFSTKRWSLLDVDMRSVEYNWWRDRHGVLLNGSFYWLYGTYYNPSILAFDFHAETFQEIELCDDLKFYSQERHGSRNLLIAELDDDSLGVCDSDTDIHGVDVWAMKKNDNKFSWTKKFSVKSVELKKFDKIVNFGVHRNSLVLLCKRNWGLHHVLVACTPEDDEQGRTKFTIRTLLERDNYDKFFNASGVLFRSTLVSLPELKN